LQNQTPNQRNQRMPRGGFRPGAGRKPKPRAEPVRIEANLDKVAPEKKDDALRLLLDIAFGRIAVDPTQLRAAIAAVQYTHTKRHDGGKKDEIAEKAKTAAGKFGARPAPLKLVG
jgi:phage terminase small subunit